MKIMVCYDASLEANEVLIEAGKHAVAFNAEVVVVTSVVSAQKSYRDTIDIIEQKLKEAENYLSEKKISCKTVVSYRNVDDTAGENLSMFAEKENVDLIIVGVVNKSRLSKFIMGSSVQFLILSAKCPVLTVKKKSPVSA